jgi:hypothetical protein
MEAFDPGEERPEIPEDFAGGEAWEEARDAWDAEHGYNGETERCERAAEKFWRCARCSDLAAAYEELGYCMIVPGDLIACNIEYAWENAGARRKWTPDASGTLQPRPWDWRDHLRDRIALHFVKARLWLHWKVYCAQLRLRLSCDKIRTRLRQARQPALRRRTGWRIKRPQKEETR